LPEISRNATKLSVKQSPKALENLKKLYSDRLFSYAVNGIGSIRLSYQRSHQRDNCLPDVLRQFRPASNQVSKITLGMYQWMSRTRTKMTGMSW